MPHTASNAGSIKLRMSTPEKPPTKYADDPTYTFGATNSTVFIPAPATALIATPESTTVRRDTPARAEMANTSAAAISAPAKATIGSSSRGGLL